MMQKLWNRINYQVYSLATINKGEANMNICTYVTSFSMQPKKYMVAVYKGTKTAENLQVNKYAVLQVLTQDQIHMVKLLGYKSGYKVNKLTNLEDHLNHNHFHIPYLKNCAGIFNLELESLLDEASDHLLALFKVHGTNNLSQSAQLLTTFDLKQQGIITA